MLKTMKLDPISDAEALAITGGKWRCRCYSFGRHRSAMKNRTVYVQALDAATARKVACEVTGLKHCEAKPWRPWADPAMRGFIREVDDA